MAKNLEFDGYSERVKQIKSMRSSAEWGFMVPEACRYQLSRADHRVQKFANSKSCKRNKK